MSIAGHHSMLNVKAAVIPTAFRWLRMTVLATRSEPQWCQLSDIRIPGYSWPSGASVTALVDGRPGVGTKPDSEGPSKLIDNSVYTKYCQDAGGAGATVVCPLEITIDLGPANKLDVLQHNEWTWYTANDVYGRDPVSFQFWGSDDNSAYYKLDEALNKNITTRRRTLAYTGNLIIPQK